MKNYIPIAALLLSDLSSGDLMANAHKLSLTSPDPAAQPAATAAQSEGHPAVWPNT